MPAATWFKITTRHHLFRDEAGLTVISSRALSAREALNWILRALPEDAIHVDHKFPVTVITIDWSKVPLEIRDPEIPPRSR